MRVVLTGIYNSSDIRTGPEEVAVSVFREMQKITETFFVTKFSMIKPHSFWQKLFGLKQEGNLFYCGFLRMPFLVKKLNPDILHGINYHPFVGLLFLLFSGSKTRLCYTVHGVVAYENSRKKYLTAYFRFSRRVTEYLIFSYAKTVYLLTEYTRKQILDYYRKSEAEYIYTINGINPETRNAGIPMRFQAKKMRIAAVAGLMDRIYGIEILFDALIGTGIEFELTIFGETEHLIVPAPLRGKVKIIAKVSHKDFIEELRSTDLYVCLSLFETFSISTAEAMACGCAVLVSDKAGISNYITHNENGLIASPENPSEIKKLILHYYENREELMKIGTAARSLSEMFTWEKVVRDYISGYKLV